MLFHRPQKQDCYLTNSTFLDILSKDGGQFPDANSNLSSLSGSNVQNPFLLRRDVQRLYHLVFSPTERQEQQQNASSKVSHNLFRTFMILAIASVLPYRQGTHPHHPYGYFLSAMQNLDDALLSRGLHSIQDLLLVGRFGIYHHIGKLSSCFQCVGFKVEYMQYVRLW